MATNEREYPSLHPEGRIPQSAAFTPTEQADLRYRKERSGAPTAEKEADTDQLVNASMLRRGWIKFCYGLAEGGLYMVNSIQALYLSAFFLEVAQIDPTEAGIIILLSEVFDALTDPLVGKLSDQTRTRLGRRRPWLLLGALPLAICFWVLFTVPSWPEKWMTFVFYLTMAALFRFFYAAVAVPYTAMTPELTMDYDQRTSLTTWRMTIGMIGSIVSATGHAMVLEYMQSENGSSVQEMTYAYMVSVGVWSGTAFLLILVTGITLRETLPEELMTTKMSFRQLLRESKEALFTREFLSVTAMYALSWVAINLLQGNLFLYVKYGIHEEEHFSIILVIIQLVAILSMAFWMFLSRKTGKRITAWIGYAILIPTCIGFGFIPEGYFPWVIVLACLGGLGLSNMLLMPWSMLPDVMELDEARCGHRREGLFYSWFVFIQKIGVGLSLGLSSLVLGWVGYVPPSDDGTEVTQSSDVIIALRCIVGIVPAILLLGGALAVVLFPISRSSHTQVSEQILLQRKNRLMNPSPNASFATL